MSVLNQRERQAIIELGESLGKALAASIRNVDVPTKWKAVAADIIELIEAIGEKE